MTTLTIEVLGQDFFKPGSRMRNPEAPPNLGSNDKGAWTAMKYPAGSVRISGEPAWVTEAVHWLRSTGRWRPFADNERSVTSTGPEGDTVYLEVVP